MDSFQAIILGIVEGLTEFLPISSTGHLILTNQWFNIDPEQPAARAFLFVSQIGAILAVVLYFWRDLWRRVLSVPGAAWHKHILVKLFVAFLPSAVVGLTVEIFFDDFMQNLERNAIAVAVALIIGAFIIELIDRRCRRLTPMTLDDVTLKQCLIIGLAQCLSIIPGTSRAGATIMGGMASGLSPSVAAEFSFYLAIPTICAAGGWRLLRNYQDITPESAGVIGLGTAVAFVVALAVVAGFMGYVKRYRFTPFAIYRVLLGATVLALCLTSIA